MLADEGRRGTEGATETASDVADDVVRVLRRGSEVGGAAVCRRSTSRRGSSFDCSLLCPLGTGELDRVSKEGVAIGGCSSGKAQATVVTDV
jgi:hypothetical protein